MRTLGLVGPLLVAALVFACSSELPTPAEAPELLQATQQAQESSEQQRESQSASEPRQSSESRAQAQRSERETTEPQDSEQQASPEPQSRDANQTESASAATEAVGDEAEPEADSEEPSTELTAIPATVVADADVRVRPGLPWRVTDRLSTGYEVVVLNVAWGWYRISYGDDREGWIRTPALDLGAIESHRILDQPAPAIVAEWQGEEYGVMGQSADGTEVRLLVTDDASSEVLGAPIDEVRLLAEDISVHDLPILIGDETVVFPGDDFRVGQGKILPKANEWMWLPWGWLLAHNDKHIWQWRPDTDELELIRRPPGPAKLSPTGQHLAILVLPGEFAFGTAFQDVVVVPLDGSAPASMRQQFEDAIARGHVGSTLSDYGLRARSAMDLNWSVDGTAVAVRLHSEAGDSYFYPALLMHTSGGVTIHHGLADGTPPGLDCYFGSLGGNTSLLDWWWLREDSTFAIYGLCATDEDAPREEFDIVFGLSGKFLRVEPFSWRRDDEAAVNLVRSAPNAHLLGDRLLIDWSPTGRYALVIDRQEAFLMRYDAKAHQLQEFSLVSGTAQSADLNGAGLIQPLHDGGLDLRWDVYWYDDSTASVIIRDSETIVAGLLLNIADGVAWAIEFGPPTYWPCQRTGSWRPDGRQFQLTLGRQRFLVALFEADGQFRRALRMAGHHSWDAAPRHQADWSPNSEWFAIGGDHQPTQCFYGH